MRYGFLGSLAGLFAGATLSLAQAPLPAGPVPSVGAPAPLAISPLDGGSPYNTHPAPPLSGGGPVGSPGCTSCGGALDFHAPACASPYLPVAGAGSPPCLNGPATPTPYLPRPCPTEGRGCGCKPVLPMVEPECHLDLHITGGIEYLQWWVKKGSVNEPLVTTAPGTTLPVLSNPATSVLFGGSPINYDSFPGGRLFLDFWHDPSRSAGVGIDLFALGHQDVTFRAASDAGGTPSLGVPFFNTATRAQGVSLAAFPGAFAGSVAVKSGSDLWGAEGNLLWRVPFATQGNQGGVWLLAGFRYLDLGESLSVTQNSNILGGANVAQPNGGVVGLQGGIVGPIPGALAPTQVLVRDSFQTRNEFYGMQIGARAEVQRGDAFAEITGKLGLGINHEILKIDGSTGYNPGGPSGGAGGLLAVGSNSGNISRNEFAFVPQVGLKVGYYLLPHLRGYVGYDFLWYSDVLRPGTEIDRNVNPGQVPTSLSFGAQGGPARPGVLRDQTDYWAHGFNVGLDFTY